MNITKQQRAHICSMFEKWVNETFTVLPETSGSVFPDLEFDEIMAGVNMPGKMSQDEMPVFNRVD